MTAMVAGSPVVRDFDRTRALWGVVITFLVHGLVVSTWVSRVASVKSLLHLDDGVFGLALLGGAIGSVTAIPVCGMLVARYGNRTIARWSSLCFCVVLVLPALAFNAGTLFAALLAFGAMAGANDVAMNAQAVATEKRLGMRAMSRFHAVFSIGGIAGSAVGAMVAGWRVTPLVHLGCAAFLLLGVAAAGSWFTPDVPVDETSVASGRMFRRVPAALIALSAIGFCIFLSEGAIADWTGVYLKQVIHTTDGFAPIGYAVFSTSMAGFRLAGDRITNRLGGPLTVRLGGSLAAAGIALAVFVSSPWVVLVGIAAAGAGFSSIIPLVFAAGGRFKSMAEGIGVATVSGIGYLGFLIGPPAIGMISQMSSLRVGLFLLVVLSAAAVLLVSVVERRNPELWL
jgi:MFS family permease